ncbi:phage tail tube protein [Streptomyces sp. NPDC057617]|uniref:phage tail tube protein n=1 Tax=Streptomyces sp. NPDC057617 TaxID=3346184 RepID=UPI0036CC8C6C
MTTPPQTATETALARRWKLEINMGTADEPDWQLCPGITEFQWTAAPNHEDSSEYDGEGWAGNDKTGQAWEVVATFNRKVSPDSTVYSPVHEAIRLAFFANGDASRNHLRFLDRKGGPEAYEGRALPVWEPQGGPYTALDQIQCTWTGTGPLTPITNPLAV